MYILPIFGSFRPLASSFTSRLLSYHWRTIPLAQGVNVLIGHFSLGGTVWGLGPPNVHFCPFSAVWRPIARSFIHRSLPVRHLGRSASMTVPVSFRKVMTFGVRAPQMYILLIFSTLAASTYLSYRPIVVVPLPYDTSGPGRQ